MNAIFAQEFQARTNAEWAHLSRAGNLPYCIEKAEYPGGIRSAAKKTRGEEYQFSAETILTQENTALDDSCRRNFQGPSTVDGGWRRYFQPQSSWMEVADDFSNLHPVWMMVGDGISKVHPLWMGVADDISNLHPVCGWGLATEFPTHIQRF